MEVDPVKQRARDLGLVIDRTARGASTGASGIIQVPAAARIHGRYQLDPSRIGNVRIRTRDRYSAGFKGLAQGFQGRSRKLRQLIKKVHAMMRQRDLARLHFVSAPTKDGGGRMMRIPKRAPPEEATSSVPATE